MCLALLGVGTRVRGLGGPLRLVLIGGIDGTLIGGLDGIYLGSLELFLR